jgi:vancomycin resistance protein YoaR
VGRHRRDSGAGPPGVTTGDTHGDGTGDGSGDPDTTRRTGSRRLPALLVGGVLGLLLLVYAVDLIAGRDSIPRNTEVSGIDISGLSPAAARQTLNAELGPSLNQDIAIEAGPVRTSLTPAAAGLRADWDATVRHAARQPLNPFTRFFGHREIDLVSTADPVKLADALDGINSLVRTDPVNGGIRYEGTTPTAVAPAPGRSLDLAAATSAITGDWTAGLPITLPLTDVAPATPVGEDAIERTMAELATPAVSGPVTVSGNGAQAQLQPSDIAEALSFTPDGNGGLKPVLDVPRLTDALQPALASTERPAQDATVTLVDGHPEVSPSVDGHGIDYPATFTGLVDILKQPTGRQVTAVYADQPAALTTEQVDALGISDQMSTFSTGGFAVDSGQNIKRAADAINGKIIKPGETFSLNDATGPRDAPQGYVPAGIIEGGHPARGIGGGVSQLATTLYNAAYFAGMTDVAHQEHSFYISRYPVAREATVFEGSIDLKFRNDLPTGVLVQTVWTPADITVSFWGTKRFDVTSATSPRTDPIPPQTLTMPPGQPCTPSAGGAGFTATDTRTLRDRSTGQIQTSAHTVHYKPSPKVVCAPPPSVPN